MKPFIQLLAIVAVAVAVSGYAFWRLGYNLGVRDSYARVCANLNVK